MKNIIVVTTQNLDGYKLTNQIILCKAYYKSQWGEVNFEEFYKKVAEYFKILAQDNGNDTIVDFKFTSTADQYPELIFTATCGKRVEL